MQGDSCCTGVLTAEYDRTIKVYDKLQKRWKKLADFFTSQAKEATSENEISFCKALAACFTQLRNTHLHCGSGVIILILL